MDKYTRSYIAYSTVALSLFACLLAAFAFIYRYFTLEAYSRILLVLMLLTGLFIFSTAATMAAVVVAYRRKHVTGFLKLPVKLGLRILLPLTSLAAAVFKGSRDTVRRLYVDVNNILVESGAMRFKPEEILILLPHCLQNSGCNLKITNDIHKCAHCGKCCIDEISGLAEEKGVKAVVVTGGTAARAIVKNERPKLLLSVACERDLSVGIADVGGIPVVGVINQRPNGPCKDTTVDMELFKRKLELVLPEKTEEKV